LAQINNQGDRTGTHAQDEVWYVRRLLWRAFIGYVPPPESDDNMVMEYIGDRFLEDDRSSYWHRFEFSSRCPLDAVDWISSPITDLNRVYIDFNSSDPDFPDNPMESAHIELNRS
jgi:hypothetical protein